MLLVAKIGRDRAGYYVEHVSPSDASAAGFSERPGHWAGALAARLGLEGSVEAVALRRVLASRHPADGAPLHPAADRVRVAAFDGTFAAPKSVSLLHALSSPEVVAEVAAAHEAAVEAGLSYLAAHGLAVRRSVAGESRQEPVTGMLAAVFVHRTSRAGDPHLHSHALIANVGADREGRLRALDGRPLYLHLSSASALYDAALRDGLSRRLGVVWRFRQGAGWDVSGLSDATLEAFSRRRREILAELEASGRHGRRAAEVAAWRTRPAKDHRISYDALASRWRETAYGLGISDCRWQALLGPGGIGSGNAWRVASPSQVASLVADAADGLEAPFSRRELVAEAARQSRAGAGAAALEQAIDGVLDAGVGLEPLGDRPARLAGEGRPLSAGRSEAVYRSARLARAEAALIAELSHLEASGLDRDGPPDAFGRRALLVPAGRVLEALAAVADRARNAAAEGLAVRAHAPSPREADAFAALTGVPATSGPWVPMPSPTGLLFLVGADRFPVAGLAQLLGVARAREAPLGLLVSPSPTRGAAASTLRPLLVAAAGRIAAPPWSAAAIERRSRRAESAVPSSNGPSLPMAQPRGDHGRAEAADLEAAVALALGALAQRRSRAERAVLVAPDRVLASSLDRLVPERVRRAVGDLPPVVHAGSLLEGHGGAEFFVVLGGDFGLGRHALGVAVAPLAPLERPVSERAVLLERRVGRQVGAARGVSLERGGRGREAGSPTGHGIGR